MFGCVTVDIVKTCLVIMFSPNMFSDFVFIFPCFMNINEGSIFEIFIHKIYSLSAKLCPLN